MATSISSLFVELKLSAENFNNGLKQAQREAKEFEKDLKPTLTVVKDLGVAMTAAGAAIAGGMLVAAKAAVNYGDALNDARNRTGATVEQLAKLGFAAEQSGSSFEGVSTGLKFLAKNMEAAIAKGGEQRAAFNALGISSKQLSAAQGDVNKVFLLLADRLKEVEDPAQKTALLIQLLGRAGGDMAELMSLGSDGIKELGNQAEKAGVVPLLEFAQASDKLNDSLTEAKASLLGASITIAESLLPTLQSAASITTEAIQSFTAFAKEHDILIKAAAALGAVLLTLGTALTAIAIIVPKIQAGFGLVQLAFGYFGVTVTAATVGVVALGAAIGVAVGALINWAIEGTRVQKWLDGFIDGTLKKLGFQWSATSEAQKSAEFTAKAVAKATENTANATKVATDIGKKHVPTVLDEAAAAKAHEAALKKEKEAIELTGKALEISLKLNTSLLEVQSDLLTRSAKHDWPILAGSITEAAAAANLASAQMANLSDSIAETTGASGQLNEATHAYISLMKLDPGVHIAEGFELSADAIKKNSEEAKALDKATADIKNSAGHIFDDMFIKGESVFSSLGNALKGGVLSLGRSIFEDVTAALLGPIKKAFDDFFQGLLEGIGFKKFLSGIGDAIGNAISGIFGGGSAVAGAASSAGGAASSAGGTAASTGASAIVGAVAGVVSAISGIIGNFQNARQEGTLNAVEANTRFTYIEIKDMMDLILQPIKARTEDIAAELQDHKYLPFIVDTLLNLTINAVYEVKASVEASAAAIVGAIGGIAFPAATTSALSAVDVGAISAPPISSGPGIRGIFGVPSYASGTSYVPRTGMAMLHKGEAVTPASQNGMNVTININGSVLGTVEDLSRLMAKELSRYVERGGGRLVASTVNA